jgi:hypothetical protein
MKKNMEPGNRVITKNKIQVTTHKRVKGIVYKVETDIMGNTNVYFITEDNQLKCFKPEELVSIGDKDMVIYNEIIREMINKLDEHYNDEELIIFLNDMLDSMKKNPAKFITDFKNLIFDTALDRDCCAECGSKLKIVPSANGINSWECTNENCKIHY